MKSNASVRTCLWFDGQGEEAARFYVSLLPDSAIEGVHHSAPDGPALIVEFSLAGAPYMILNGGPRYAHTPRPPSRCRPGTRRRRTGCGRR